MSDSARMLAQWFQAGREISLNDDPENERLREEILSDLLDGAVAWGYASKDRTTYVQTSGNRIAIEPHATEDGILVIDCLPLDRWDRFTFWIHRHSLHGLRQRLQETVRRVQADRIFLGQPLTQ